MSDTIFYSLRLKKNKTPAAAFEKIIKAVKPKGPTSAWSVTAKGDDLIIDFGDSKSETFCLSFKNKEAGGFCKVAFPMEGELFDNEKKSEWKTLISVLHSIKPMCSEIRVDDDYSIASEYFESLDYTFGIRELSENEKARLDNLFERGYTNHEQFLLKIFSEDTQREYPNKLEKGINPGVKLRDPFPEISALWETYIYETSTLKKQCIRDIYKDDVKINDDGISCISGDPPAEIYTFALGVGALFSCYNFMDNTWGRGANVTKYFNDKFIPLFNSSDNYERCKLAYQFMLSVYDYCKFKFVGKDIISQMIKECENVVRVIWCCDCSACDNARKWFAGNKIKYYGRSNFSEKPSHSELKEWQAKSGISLDKFFNTRSKRFKEKELDLKLPEMSEDEQLKLLSSDPKLLKCPIAVKRDTVLVGFNKSEWNEKLK